MRNTRKAKVGFVHNGKLREDDLEVGTLHFIPKGSLFYAINNDQNHNLVLGSLLYNPDPYRQRHHDVSFFGPCSLINTFSFYLNEIIKSASPVGVVTVVLRGRGPKSTHSVEGFR